MKIPKKWEKSTTIHEKKTLINQSRLEADIICN